MPDMTPQERRAETRRIRAKYREHVLSVSSGQPPTPWTPPPDVPPTLDALCVEAGLTEEEFVFLFGEP